MITATNTLHSLRWPHSPSPVRNRRRVARRREDRSSNHAYERALYMRDHSDRGQILDLRDGKAIVCLICQPIALER